ncbi:hypothetical protein N7540_001289 [Penicillium herquei]|nr:hypothetical protein N7540_001289 [Penicillium herquei]
MGGGPMNKLRGNGCYRWYTRANRSDMTLPELEKFTPDGETYQLWPGERYCRVAGCENRTMFATPGNLRSHIRKKHEIELEPIPTKKWDYAPWVFGAMSKLFIHLLGLCYMHVPD